MRAYYWAQCDFALTGATQSTHKVRQLRHAREMCAKLRRELPPTNGLVWRVYRQESGQQAPREIEAWIYQWAGPGHRGGWVRAEAYSADTEKELAIVESKRAARSNAACGRAIQQMVDAIGNYCLEYKGATDQGIGDDYVLGPEARAILSALRGLLDGPTGSLDCGKVDGRLLEIARTHGLADDNGEV